MSSNIVAVACILLGIHHLYAGLKNKNIVPKKEWLFRIGVGIFMCVLGSILFIKL